MEKITINLVCRPGSSRSDGAGRVLLEPCGFLSDGDPQSVRTSFRRCQKSTARKNLNLGVRNYSREDLEAAQRTGEMLHNNVLGLVSILNSPQSLTAMSMQKNVHRGRFPGGLAHTRTMHTDASGREIFEHWNIHGAGHAWSGATLQDRTLIRENQTQRGKCCVSFSNGRPHSNHVRSSHYSDKVASSGNVSFGLA